MKRKGFIKRKFQGEKSSRSKFFSRFSSLTNLFPRTLTHWKNVPSRKICLSLSNRWQAEKQFHWRAETQHHIQFHDLICCVKWEKEESPFRLEETLLNGIDKLMEEDLFTMTDELVKMSGRLKECGTLLTAFSTSSFSEIGDGRAPFPNQNFFALFHFDKMALNILRFETIVNGEENFSSIHLSQLGEIKWRDDFHQSMRFRRSRWSCFEMRLMRVSVSLSGI